MTKGQLRVSLKQVTKCLVIVGFVSVKLMFIIGDPNHYDRSRKGGAVDLEKFKIWKSHTCIATKSSERMTNVDLR